MLVEDRMRLEELLRDVVKRPEVPRSLAIELEQVFYVLRNYAYFVTSSAKSWQSFAWRWTGCDAHPGTPRTGRPESPRGFARVG